MEVKFLLLLLAPALVQCQSPIGGACTIPDDCVDRPRSDCDSVTGRCKCITDHVASQDKLECLPIVNDHEDSCKETPQCTGGDLGSESHCLGLKCVCLPTAIYVPGSRTCLKKANFIDDPCSDNLQCSPNLGDDAFCNVDKCQCDLLVSIPNRDGTKCLHKVDIIGDPCEETGQCKLGKPGDYSQCYLGKCTCNTNAIPIGNECFPKSELNKPCTLPEQCGDPLATCLVGFCRCKPNEAVEDPSGTGCLELAKNIGDLCQASIQCLQGKPGIYSACVSDQQTGVKTCQCTSEAIEIPTNPTCQKIATHLGEPCLINEQCRINLGSLSMCGGGVCTCSPGSVGSSDGTRCLPGDILIGDGCEDTAQCVGNAECTATGHCSCPITHVPSNNLRDCLPIINRLNEECKEPQQCQQGEPGPWSDCLEKFGTSKLVCQCKSEAITGPGGSQRCLKKATFVGDSCEIIDQCLLSLGRSHCTANTCQCYPDSNPSADKTKCVIKAGLGKICEDDGQCSHIPTTGSATCQPIDPGFPQDGSICACKPGYSQAPGGQEMCIRVAGLIGDPCQADDSQCSGIPDSVCDLLTKTCQCDPSKDLVAHPDRIKCLPVANKLEDSCEHQVQCMPGQSECIIANGTIIGQCLCRPGQFVESRLNPGNCVEVRKQKTKISVRNENFWKSCLSFIITGF